MEHIRKRAEKYDTHRLYRKQYAKEYKVANLDNKFVSSDSRIDIGWDKKQINLSKTYNREDIL